jgi:polysaccharide biosynthesis transport protein
VKGPAEEMEQSVAGATPYREMQLVDYLAVLWEWKTLILVGTVTSALFAIIGAFLSPKIYEGVASLIVLTPRFRVENAAPGQLEAMEARVAKSYEGMIKSRAALTATLDEFGLRETGLELRDLEEAVNVSATKDSNVLHLAVRMSDPEVAAGIANFVARKAIDLNRELAAGELGQSRTFLQSESERAGAELARVEKELEEFKKDAAIEILSKDVEIRLTGLAEMEVTLGKVVTELAGTRSRAETLSKELAEQPVTFKTSSGLVNDQAYQQLLARLSSSESKELMSLKMQTDELNPTYPLLSELLARQRSEIDGFIGKEKSLRAQIEQYRSDLSRLQKELVEKTSQQTRLSRSYEIAVRAFNQLRESFEDTNVAVVSQSGQLKLLDPALPPAFPVGPRRALAAAIGAVCGFLAMIVLAFLMNYIERAGGIQLRPAAS